MVLPCILGVQTWATFMARHIPNPWTVSQPLNKTYVPGDLEMTHLIEHTIYHLWWPRIKPLATTWEHLDKHMDKFSQVVEQCCGSSSLSLSGKILYTHTYNCPLGTEEWCKHRSLAIPLVTKKKKSFLNSSFPLSQWKCSQLWHKKM